MSDYRIVKYCRMCKKRYLVNKGESRKNYCDDCEIRLTKMNEDEAKAEKKAKAEKRKAEKEASIK